VVPASTRNSSFRYAGIVKCRYHKVVTLDQGHIDVEGVEVQRA